MLKIFTATLLLSLIAFITSCSDKPGDNTPKDTTSNAPVSEQNADQTTMAAHSKQTDYSNWNQVVAAASGQIVYWNAWGGSNQINQYISWAGEQLQSRYNITLKQVKVDDIATSVNRVLAEFSAGKKTEGGTVDLMWINGENFRSMKEHKMLFGPFTQYLPNYKLVDTVNKPTTTMDFGTPVEGLEAPWGMAHFVFIYDSERMSKPPRNIMEMLEHGRKNPGRITYPKPPHYLGTTFLKQALYHFVEDHDLLQQPVNQVNFEELTASLWMFLDEFHQYAWNKGNSFPNSGPDQTRLLNDNEIDFSMAFNPAEASANINTGLLPGSARTFVFEGGGIGNTHFVAIPANSSAKEAAMVTANFLMSPEAQLRKQDAQYFGDFTVLDINRLKPAEQEAFNSLPLGIATLSPIELGVTLPEPHPDWVQMLEQTWEQRYLK